jgi:hypothetical protein
VAAAQTITENMYEMMKLQRRGRRLLAILLAFALVVLGSVAGYLSLQKPMLLIGSDNPCMPPDCEPTDPIDRADQAATRSLLAASGSSVWFYRIRGALHFNFSDYAVYYLAAPLHRLLGMGEIDGRRGLAITNAYLVAFLDRYARGGSESLLAVEPSPYPEVRRQRTR